MCSTLCKIHRSCNWWKTKLKETFFWIKKHGYRLILCIGQSPKRHTCHCKKNNCPRSAFLRPLFFQAILLISQDLGAKVYVSKVTLEISFMNSKISAVESAPVTSDYKVRLQSESYWVPFS